MNNFEFNTYKAEFRALFRTILSEAEPGRLDEAAFPAYSHPNPLINHLFWQRLRKVMEYLEKEAPYEYVLDFGCGSGVLLPFLCKISAHVVAVDIDLLPLSIVGRYRDFPPNLKVYDLKQVQLRELPAASFDRVVAMDVLEHVEDLLMVENDLTSLLRPNGELIISGPTENFFYRLGRKLAGREYSGHYHKRSINKVRKLLANMKIIPIAKLYWPIVLFDIFSVRK